MELSSVQIGIDIATSLAVAGSAGLFLWNQAQKLKQTKQQQLDAAARTVAVEQLQKALHDLSQQFVRDVVTPYQRISNLMARFNKERCLHLLEKDAERPQKILEQIEKMREAISLFIDNIYVYKYQIYPLLDTLEGGKEQCFAFREELKKLVDKYNEYNTSGKALAQELERTLAFCAEHPFKELDEAQHQRLLELSKSIMFDPDYAHWVNSFIPDEDEDVYWGKNENNNTAKVRATAMQNFVDHAYEKPNLLRYHVFGSVYLRYQELQTSCKKFLIMLAAISHNLLLSEDAKEKRGETPSKTVVRYASEDFFALDTEVR